MTKSIIRRRCDAKTSHRSIRNVLFLAFVMMSSALYAAPVVVEAANAEAIGGCSWVSALLTGIKTFGLFLIVR